MSPNLYTCALIELAPTQSQAKLSAFAPTSTVQNSFHLLLIPPRIPCLIARLNNPVALKNQSVLGASKNFGQPQALQAANTTARALGH